MKPLTIRIENEGRLVVEKTTSGYNLHHATEAFLKEYDEFQHYTSSFDTPLHVGWTLAK